MWVKGFGMSRETAPVNLTDISADFLHGLASCTVVLNLGLKLNCSSCNGLSLFTLLRILLLGIASERAWFNFVLVLFNITL
jgi:hypothetical protein